MSQSLAPSLQPLVPFLDEISIRHKHICPRIILGVRMGLLGIKMLGLEEVGERYINKNKRLFTIVEIDGCGMDGIATATDCRLENRTLRHVDYGKMAATLVDRKTEQAVRIVPSPQARELAKQIAPNAQSRWHSYLEAYQIMSDEELLVATFVTLKTPLKEVISRAGVRVNCGVCGEEIVNEREVVVDGELLCRGCAGDSYFV